MTFLRNTQVANLPTNPLRRIFEQAKPGMTNLASGHPNPVYCDQRGLEVATALAAKEQRSWRYGASAGDAELIDALPPWQAPVGGASTLVTSGAQQGIFLACQCLGAPGQTILVPDPVYPAVLSVAVLLGVKVRTYCGESPATALQDLARLMQGHDDICAVYVLPTFSNPTGETWRSEDRDALLELCAQSKVAVIEDDPYRELWFDAKPPERLIERAASLGLNTEVLSLGSLSKIVAPGLRIGWIQGNPDLIAAMTAARQAMDLQPNALAQRVACHYLQSGALERHLNHLRPQYASAHATLTAPLRAAGFSRLKVHGGMFVMPELPSGISVAGLAEHLRSHELLVAPGDAFSIDKSRPSNRLRLCFAALPPADLHRAGETLVAAVEAWR